MAWTVINASDIDADSPHDTDLVQAFDGNLTLLKTAIYGTGTYLDHAPHMHRGVTNSDGRAHAVSSGNIILNATPRTGSNAAWGISGFSSTAGIYQSKTAGHYMYQIAFERAVGTNNGHWKNFGVGGTPMLISFYGLLTAGVLAGDLTFGLADGGTADASYITGHKATLDKDDFAATSTWYRFWAYFDDTSPATALPGSTSNHSTDVRFMWRINTGWTKDIQITGFMVQLGQDISLAPFHFSHAEATFHRNYANLPTTAPLWETATMLDNAVEITAIT